MATDHRGNLVGNPTTAHGGHRPTPRLQQAIADQIQRDTNINRVAAHRYAENVINAHRGGAPVSWDNGPISTGPVMTDLNRYIGYKEYRDVMGRLGQSLYDDGRDDAFSATVENRNYPHEVNSAVRKAGGTGSYIKKAVDSREPYSDEEDEF